MVEDENHVSSVGIKVRAESLSDLVFGLALSIGSLDFLSSPAKNAHELLLNVAFFGFSFIILVFVWLGYTRTMAVLPRESSTSLFLNIVLLFLVALEPYLFFVLLRAPSIPLAGIFSVFYAINIGLMFLVQAGLARLVILEDRKSEVLHEKRLPAVIIARFRAVIISEILIGAAYLVSTLPFFWEVSTPVGQLRFVIWYSSFAIFFIRIRPKEIKNPKAEAREPSHN